ncbi:putative pectinesterase/pectinesterase inhibitor 40 [Camellia lanceoleosa]|uniref:Pectinesterase/pectinesterase inhibitor 40 n=1 Tax=Camellia lanceoleosa TaxID=1840588 RepID=A0ACC0F208_9ERIC|nr:putative pectinesterase/pectinesterase inhibitor 40 [Camellia lanceoleosa]
MYHHHLKKRTKIFLALLPISALALLTLTTLITVTKNPKNREESHHIHIHKNIQIAHSACDGTLYRDLCVSTLSTFPDLASKSLPQIIAAAVNHTMSEVRVSESNCTRLRYKLPKLTQLDKRALDDCLELLDDSISELKSTISDLSSSNKSVKHFHDLQTLLSGAMTNQFTCLDGFAYSKSNTRPFIEARLENISHHVSNALAMVGKIKTASSRAEVFPEYGTVKGGFPTWLSKKDRRLLQTAVNETRYDVVVAKDGSGNFTTIGEAVAVAPNSSATRFVIYIKAGAYFEYVEVPKKTTMLMFLGDGIGKTWVKGNRSVGDGWTTFRSSTVAVVGDGFIAKGISFENYAGPSKHQAVALRSGADLSAFYLCSFVGYQDTLYVHSLRQFYRECDIYGTIDFIFGNAAVVFQDCNLYARKPMDNQRNVFTAQGREDPNQNTGISILNCKVAAGSDLIPVQSSFRNYLGRPWKEYSRTVYLLSNIGDLVDPAGWLEWNGTFALSTLYYGEYKNRGPGSNTSARVTWPGYRVITNVTEATQFTVGNFIQGGEWLPSNNISYYLGLTG